MKSDNDTSSRKERDDGTYSFYDVGFHGDEYLLSLVDYIFRNENVERFVETGTNVGSTLAYVARKYKEIDCFSCEPDIRAFTLAQGHSMALPNAKIYNLDSLTFLERLKAEVSPPIARNTVFWLDAHGYGFEWPLKEEVQVISSAMERCYMFIDDFKVPGNRSFGYDSYGGQECSFDYIKTNISTQKYRMYYPAYSDRTSRHHPLRGWCLFVFGGELFLPDELKQYVYLYED
jgi:hypothetical protein